MNDDAPLGTFEEQVMLAVVHAGAEAFGMSVRREIESRTGREVAIGAVFATIDRLVAKKLISSIRGTTDGASRSDYFASRRRVRARSSRHVRCATGSGAV